jgi:polyhydroxybutyrate depolymerase
MLLAALAFAPVWASAGQANTDNYAGRTAIVYTPTKLPASGSRALVVVLHGGGGNAERIATQRSESALNMNAVAEDNGFIVAYLNGTPVTRMLGADKLGWNAGRCCGQPAEHKVDDVAYIQAAVEKIAEKYGVDRHKIYGVGHSNGAMMTQRVMCETKLYAAAAAISGTLETGATTCPASQGKRLLAVHGANDQNVPIGGGMGKGLAHVAFNSEAATAKVWQDSGATYELQVIPNAEHSVDSINKQLNSEGQTLGQRTAKFFGLIAN